MLYARIFVQILESSLAEDWQTRHVFEDLLKLTNRDGVVDMTKQAIARRTNIPIDIIERAISKLEAPDPHSRDSAEDGRRILRLDDHRDWGWRIVNFQKYELIRANQDMREFNAKRMARYRDNKKGSPHTPFKEDNSVQKVPVHVDVESSLHEPTCSTTRSTTPTPPPQEIARRNCPTLEQAIAHYSKQPSCDYSKDEIRAAWLSMEATINNGEWYWGKRPVGDWRAALASRIEDNRKKSSPALGSAFSLKTQLEAIDAEIKEIDQRGFEDAFGIKHKTEDKPRLRELRLKRKEVMDRIKSL